MRPAIRTLVGLLAAGTVFLPWPTGAQERPKGTGPGPEEPSVMQRKLTHAQGILAGLALSDFDRIDKDADALIRVRQEATWRINQTEQYLQYSLAFLEHLQDLKKAAGRKNLDAATLAYLEMARTCVRCHEALRTPKKMKGED